MIPIAEKRASSIALIAISVLLAVAAMVPLASKAYAGDVLPKDLSQVVVGDVKDQLVPVQTTYTKQELPLAMAASDSGRIEYLSTCDSRFETLDASGSPVEKGIWKSWPAEPTISLTDGDYTLVEGVDYTVEYKNNDNIGTAQALITGIGAYSGLSLTKDYEIVGYLAHTYTWLQYSDSLSLSDEARAEWQALGTDKVIRVPGWASNNPHWSDIANGSTIKTDDVWVFLKGGEGVTTFDFSVDVENLHPTRITYGSTVNYVNINSDRVPADYVTIIATDGSWEGNDPFSFSAWNGLLTKKNWVDCFFKSLSNSMSPTATSVVYEGEKTYDVVKGGYVDQFAKIPTGTEGSLVSLFQNSAVGKKILETLGISDDSQYSNWLSMEGTMSATAEDLVPSASTILVGASRASFSEEFGAAVQTLHDQGWVNLDAKYLNRTERPLYLDTNLYVQVIPYDLSADASGYASLDTDTAGAVVQLGESGGVESLPHGVTITANGSDKVAYTGDALDVAIEVKDCNGNTIPSTEYDMVIMRDGVAVSEIKDRGVYTVEITGHVEAITSKGAVAEGSGCYMGTASGTFEVAVDTTALESVVERAIDVRSDVVASTDGSDVSIGAKWATAEACALLDDAIESAKALATDPERTNETVKEMGETLKAALDAFELSIVVKPDPMAGTWVLQNGGWWYSLDMGGWPANQWALIDGAWYLFDADGWMLTGWQKWAGSWYYLQPSGALYAGWLSWGGSWYYLDPENDSAMATGWFLDGETWYYADASGAMQTGWLKDGGSWYYLQPSGAMLTGWLSWGGSWYYLAESGAMATGWFLDGETWYYADASGAMAHDCWVGDYYLTGSGAMATSQWVGPYWVGADGKWVPIV